MLQDLAQLVWKNLGRSINLLSFAIWEYLSFLQFPLFFLNVFFLVCKSLLCACVLVRELERMQYCAFATGARDLLINPDKCFAGFSLTLTLQRDIVD